MRVEHRAIDGSSISIEAEADLNSNATAAGWAVVPSLMQAHPFVMYPPGHSDVIEEAVRRDFSHVEVLATEEYSVKGGRLRVAQVNVPTATKERRTLSVGGWEGKTGCLTTTIVGAELKHLVEIFDSLRFDESARGLAILSPIVPWPRPPELFKEIPGVGVLAVRPAIATELERVPRARGYVTDHGELFRVRRSSQALLFVSRSVVASLTPTARDPREMLAAARSLRIEWTPRGGPH
jgi:hypothetical protein